MEIRIFQHLPNSVNWDIVVLLYFVWNLYGNWFGTDDISVNSVEQWKVILQYLVIVCMWNEKKNRLFCALKNEMNLCTYLLTIVNIYNCIYLCKNQIRHMFIKLLIYLNGNKIWYGLSLWNTVFALCNYFKSLYDVVCHRYCLTVRNTWNVPFKMFRGMWCECGHGSRSIINIVN